MKEITTEPEIIKVKSEREQLIENVQPILDALKIKIDSYYKELEELSAPADEQKKKADLSEVDARASLPYEDQWKISKIEEDLSELERDYAAACKAKTTMSGAAWTHDIYDSKRLIEKMAEKYPGLMS